MGALGRRAECKNCEKKYHSVWYLNNKDLVRVAQRQRREQDIEKSRARARDAMRRRAAHPGLGAEAIRQKRAENPEKYKASQKKFFATAKGKAAAKRGYTKRRATPAGNLNHRMSSAIQQSLTGNKGGRKWESLVGYTLDQLQRHLERHFLPGMSWENRHLWHVDHKIPLAAFNFETPDDLDFKRAWALSNLRPLWAPENQAKHAKLAKPFQPSLTIAA